VDDAKLQDGQRVLLHGASGGVGSVALQYLKARNCEVVVTASPSNFELVTRWRPDRIIDYTQPEPLAILKPKSFDIVFDAAGPEDRTMVEHQSIPLLKDGGVYVTSRGGLLPHLTNHTLVGGLLSAASDYFTLKRNNSRIKFYWGIFGPNGRALEEFRCLIESSLLHPNVDRLYQFHEFEEAHQYQLQKKSPGKIVLTHNVIGIPDPSPT